MSVHCAVCNLTLNSPLQYQQHLEGKTHLKKLKLTADTGCVSADGLPEQSPASLPRSQQQVRDVKLRDSANKSLICDLCQLIFSSQSQADDHYSGSKHAKKLRAAMLYGDVLISSGDADCNDKEEGGDTQLQSDSSLSPPPPPPPLTTPPLPPATSTGRLVLPPHQATTDQPVSPVSWTAPAKRRSETCFCTVCNAEFTSHLQAEAHFRGAKHAKRLKTAQGVTYDLKSVVDRPPGTTDVTDQGSSGFYCSFCNLYLNSLQQLDQHRLGGKHKQKLEKCKTSGNTQRSTPAQPDSYGDLSCQMCCVAFTEETAYHTHLDSLAHKNKENEVSSKMSSDWQENAWLM